MNIGVIPFEKVHGKTNIGSSRIRAYWLTKAWDDAEIFHYGKKYDALICQKAYIPNLMEVFPGPKILDICDPDWMENGHFVEHVSLFDAIVCSTTQLADFLRSVFDKPIYVIPDRHDLAWYGKPKQHTDKQADNVAWFGFSHNAKGLKFIKDDLKRFRLRLTAYSNGMNNDISSAADEFIPYDAATINENLKKHDFVVLPPDMENPNFKYKSNNRTVACWALGLPAALTREEMMRFIDPKQRKAESEKRLQEVKDLWDIKYSVQEWKNIINIVSKLK